MAFASPKISRLTTQHILLFDYLTTVLGVGSGTIGAFLFDPSDYDNAKIYFQACATIGAAGNSGSLYLYNATNSLDITDCSLTFNTTVTPDRETKRSTVDLATILSSGQRIYKTKYTVDVGTLGHVYSWLVIIQRAT